VRCSSQGSGADAGEFPEPEFGAGPDIRVLYKSRVTRSELQDALYRAGGARPSWQVYDTATFRPVVSVDGVPRERRAERRTCPQTEEVQFCAPPTSRGRPDASAWKLQLSSAMPGCVLSLPAYAFVGGETAPYLH